MSENFQDNIKATKEEFFPSKRTPEENKKLCEKYPFLKWYGDPLYTGYSEDHEPDYKYTWEDEIPDGWRKAFCPQMWDELKAILEKADYVDKFRFDQIKEKFGQLRLYFGGVPEEIFDECCAWEEKYLNLSEKVCIGCGKPAKYMSLGWISFWCEDCVKELREYVIDINDIEEYYKTPREERRKFYKDFSKND